MAKEKATFAAGCFWGVESLFGAQVGVLTTKVGYCGGTTPRPTYYKIGDHVESVEMEFDTEKTNYENLLKVFWSNHDPTSKPYKRQYISAIFYHSDEQKKLIDKTMQEQQSKLSRKIQTEVQEAGPFYDAEDYHQKYNLRCDKRLFNGLKLSDSALKTSTIAAKLNGYLGGYKKLQDFEEESKGLQLTQEQIDYVIAKIKSGISRHC